MYRPARPITFLATVAVFFTSANVAARAEPADAQKAKADLPAARDRLVTVTYDVADLARASGAWRRDFRPVRLAGADGIEAVARVIVLTVKPAGWGADKEGGSTVRVVNDSHLEIRTSKALHAEIADLLAALRRLADLTVIVRADLYEVDEAFYRKRIEADLADPVAARRFGSLIKEKVVDRLRMRASLVQTSRTTMRNGQTGRLVSMRHAFTYLARPRQGEPKDEDYAVDFHGVVFGAKVGVSADRRFVSLRLTEQVRELLEIGKKNVVDPATGDEATVKAPSFAEASRTRTVEVGDGLRVVVPVRMRLRGTEKKGRMLVLLVHPVIRIEEEERERRRPPRPGDK
jgi:hypothetical protein